jgi:hypothetical protein
LFARHCLAFGLATIIAAACGRTITTTNTSNDGTVAIGGTAGSGGMTGDGGTSGAGGQASDVRVLSPCRAAGTTFDQHLVATGSICAVMVRVNWTSTEVLGYQLNCGEETTVTEASARSPLLTISSIDWQSAPLVSDPTATGVYAFESVGPASVLAVVSARTGQELVYLIGASEVGYAIPAAWYSGSEVDGNCPDGAAVPFTSFRSADNSLAPQMAVELLRQRGLFAALGSRWGNSFDTVAVAPAQLVSGMEYLVIITVALRA